MSVATNRRVLRKVQTPLSPVGQLLARRDAGAKPDAVRGGWAPDMPRGLDRAQGLGRMRDLAE